MIYVTLGTQKFEFNRLLEYIDNAIDDGYINEEVYVQAGYSSYKPRNFISHKFIEKDTVSKIINESKFIISHGGSGNMIDALNKNKKMIIIPRDVNLNEHIDNHQYELVNKFYKNGLILKAISEDEFKEQLKNIESFEPKNINQILDNGKKIKKIIDDYIEKEVK